VRRGCRIEERKMKNTREVSRSNKIKMEINSYLILIAFIAGFQ
jgi:hypothetical protein